MFSNFFNNNNLRKYTKLVKTINKYEISFYSDLVIEEAPTIMRKIRESSTIKQNDKILHAMAIARTVSSKVLGMGHYEVQLLGALSLTDGCMAEMKTGEGKTLTCSAAVAANYVLGFKTHVATANDYLAERDSKTLKPLYDALGISSGFVIGNMNKDAKRESYSCDVIYSTAQELGFDFLRDNLVVNLEDKIQPTLSNVKAIIDEADFILIDEARTPLIISGESPIKNLNTYDQLREIALSLNKMDKEPSENYIFTEEYIPGDFWVDEKFKNVHLSEEGFVKIEKILSESDLLESEGSSLYHHQNSWLIHEILNALKAEYSFKRDRDYIVRDDSIIIVDQNTGRLSDGRTWSNGLHQAIETKEKVTINPETMTLGTISIQNYFRNYKNISGMSGTIMGSTTEFYEIYNTTTIRIPTNKPMIRKNHNDKVFVTLNGKYNDLINNIAERHSKGQPILIGTTSVAESEEISNLLSSKNIKHNVLNAKNNFREAQIIAQAGRPYAVTVSTSMAGRGTDIILGGNKVELLKILNEHKEAIEERIEFFSGIKAQIHEQGVEIEEPSIEIKEEEIDIDSIHERLIYLYDQDNLVNTLNSGINNVMNYLNILLNVTNKEIDSTQTEHESWKKLVISNGGLLVIGSSRNESRRIDDQLRGRAGRQGDPGESVFYVSFEDSWVSVLGKNPIFQQLAKSIPENEAIESSMITKALAKAQNGIEGVHYTSRKSTFQYDSIADEGRRQFLAFRDLLIKDTNAIINFTKTSLLEELLPITSEDFSIWYEDKNNSKFNSIHEFLQNDILKTVKLVQSFKEEQAFYRDKDNRSKFIEELETSIENIFSNIEENIYLELNSFAINRLDKKWTEHLVFVEDARQNVAFSGMAQKNPLHEFKKLCFDSFNGLFREFALDCIENLSDIQNREPVRSEEIVDIIVDKESYELSDIKTE